MDVREPPRSHHLHTREVHREIGRRRRRREEDARSSAGSFVFLPLPFPPSPLLAEEAEKPEPVIEKMSP